MTDEELTALTQQISVEKFQKMFKHRVSFNQRLRTTGGRYVLSTGNIEVNPKSMNNYGHQEVIDIVKHELCHYHLHLEGKGYKHQDREFQELLKQVGGAMHCNSLEQYRLKQKKGSMSNVGVTPSIIRRATISIDDAVTLWPADGHTVGTRRRSA